MINYNFIKENVEFYLDFKYSVLGMMIKFNYLEEYIKLVVTC